MPVIRPAEAGDLEAVAAIQSASPEASHWPVAEYFQYQFKVAVSGGAVVGFLVWRRSCRIRSVSSMTISGGQRTRFWR